MAGRVSAPSSPRIWLALVGCVLAGVSCDEEPGSEAGHAPEIEQPSAAGDSAESSGRVDAGAELDAGPGLRAVTLQFEGRFGSEPLACGRTHAGAAMLRDFRFFVQDVTLIGRSGERARVQLVERAPFQTPDVALIDLAAGQCGASSEPGRTTLEGEVEPGEYTALELTLGVPERVNHQNFAAAKAPLADASTYWGWANGYRFILAAISLPTSGDALAADGGAAEEPGSSVVHVGAGGCSGSTSRGFACSRPNRARIRLDDFDPERSVIVADLAQVFSELDVQQGVVCHGFAPECAGAYAALGLDGQGQATDTQRVFSAQLR